MRSVHLAHPADRTVAVLFADALMNTTPWDCPNPARPHLLAHIPRSNEHPTSRHGF
jgi:hypothetical protein